MSPVLTHGWEGHLNRAGVHFYGFLLFLICFTDQVIFMLNEIDPETPIGEGANTVRLEKQQPYYYLSSGEPK